MSLSPGTKLGPYEILSPIGAGGMGEVYRARDPKLGREIAVKILSGATASDPDRRQRFELEARAASALNHPNILTVYDVGEADGSLYIAMELVEGKTLRELVAAGEPLPTKKSLDLSVQIAEGLAKAHAAGIVHRDLKPENLMISKDGFVKILDFGLAKLTETVSKDESIAPTAIAAPTQPGTVMGTVGYMSPEQASGQAVDYRSDQFTLGAILYEMATGKRAFQRKTGAETLVAIIREEPEPLSQAAPRAPAPVRWIVERLLAKDPEERYASTKDLARDLKSVRDHLTESSLSGSLETAERAKLRRRGWLAPALLALALGAALGALALARLGRKPATPIQFQQLTFQRGQVLSARFAPDGQTMVYSAAWEGRPPEVFTTRPESAESRSLGLPGATVLSVSSTGEIAVSLNRHFIVGYEGTGTLARVPLAGGSPREVLESAQDADWSPDGKELAVCRVVGNRSRVEYPVGKVLFEAAGWTRSVRVSPDGRLVAFIDCPQRGNNDGRLKVVDASGKLRLEGPMVRGAAALAWSVEGRRGVVRAHRHRWSGPEGNQRRFPRREVPLGLDDSPGGARGSVARRSGSAHRVHFPTRAHRLRPRRSAAQPHRAQLVVSERHLPRRQHRSLLRADPPAARRLRPKDRRVARGSPGRRRGLRILAGRPVRPDGQVARAPVDHARPDGRGRVENHGSRQPLLCLGQLVSGRKANPDQRQRARQGTASVRPGRFGRQPPADHPGRRHDSRPGRLPRRQVASRPAGRTAGSRSTRPSPAAIRVPFPGSSPRTSRSGGRPTAARSTSRDSRRCPGSSTSWTSPPGVGHRGRSSSRSTRAASSRPARR